MEKTLLAGMKAYRDSVENKRILEKNLENLMKEKFPNIKDIYFSDCQIKIITTKHEIALYSWGSLKNTSPKMMCDLNQKMPDTPEEFMAMKTFVEDDYRQCYTAFFWLFNRYYFGYEY